LEGMTSRIKKRKTIHLTRSKQRVLKDQTGTEPSSRSDSNRSYQRPNEKDSRNRISIYNFRSIVIKKQSERPWKICCFDFPAVQTENSIRITRTIQNQPQDDDRNE
jgi:hypothetical protein